MRLDRRGLVREAGVEEDFLAELEQYGFLTDDVLFYGTAELEIVTAARDLADEGLHPRHLVMPRTAAEREAHMIRSVARPRSRAGDAAARGEAEDFARDLGESIIALHGAIRARSRGRSERTGLLAPHSSPLRDLRAARWYRRGGTSRYSGRALSSFPL
ncbi:hypothetical protein [Brachybacterium sp. GPGPB12]|uniref:hypothetical protein n=1 Tax=Brachybacterium sp. GPGPB12 TaxID=3023517 RepID=UPI0031345B67